MIYALSRPCGAWCFFLQPCTISRLARYTLWQTQTSKLFAIAFAYSPGPFFLSWNKSVYVKSLDYFWFSDQYYAKHRGIRAYQLCALEPGSPSPIIAYHPPKRRSYMNRLLRSIICSLPNSDVKAQEDEKYYRDLWLAIRGAVSLSAFSIRT